MAAGASMAIILNSLVSCCNSRLQDGTTDELLRRWRFGVMDDAVTTKLYI